MEATNRARVICVDDEPHVVSGLALHLRRRYDVEVATSGQVGLELLARPPEAAVVISDMRMPGMNGAEFLAKVHAQSPNTTRILLTGYAELDAAIRAINEGNVFRFLVKPCPPPELLRTVDAAAEHHRLKLTEKVLLEKTLHGSVRMLSEALAITNPLAFGRATRIKTLVSQLLDKLGDKDRWQVEVAAMLSQLPTLTLPDETAEKLYYGAALSEAEQQMVERAPDVTQQLLGHIPRLEAVREILTHYREPQSKRDIGELSLEQRVVRRGSQLLKVAVEFDALEAQGRLGEVDAVLSGYLGSAEQAPLIVSAVTRAKTSSKTPLYCLDPAFGDDGRIYARPGVMEAMRDLLLPLADIVRGNVFELSTLSGIEVADVDTAIEAARKLARPIVVATSVPVEDELGTLLVTRDQALLATTPRLAAPPHGAGDLFTALLFGHMVLGETVDAALQGAVRSTYHILKSSDGAPEMALIAEQAALDSPPEIAGFALTPIDLRRRAHG